MRSQLITENNVFVYSCQLETHSKLLLVLQVPDTGGFCAVIATAGQRPACACLTQPEWSVGESASCCRPAVTNTNASLTADQLTTRTPARMCRTPAA